MFHKKFPAHPADQRNYQENLSKTMERADFFSRRGTLMEQWEAKKQKGDSLKNSFLDGEVMAYFPGNAPRI